MGNTPNQARGHYWLLIGSAPSGPFTVEQVHAKLTAREITWEILACPLGGTAWLPLARTLGLGPPQAPASIRPVTPVPTAAVTANPNREMKALPANASGAEVSSPREAQRIETPQEVGSSLGSKTPAHTPNWAGVAVTLVVLAFLGWLGYEWLRPLTPREVCERLDKVHTAKEACRYCTLNFQPAIEAMYRQHTPDSADDKYEYTQEGEAPPGIGGYFVGIRGQFHVPEERRRVQVDGVIHLIKSDGWKIEDMYFLSVDRQLLPEPISMASNYHLFFDQPPGSDPIVQSAITPGPAKTAPTQAKAWYDNRVVQGTVSRGIYAFLSSGGGKALGAFLLVVLVGIIRFGREIFASLASGFSGQQRCG